MKYNKEANSVISINLHNDYFIIAMTKWDNECRKYYTTLYIKHKTIDILDKLEGFENIECTTTSTKEINSEVANFVINKFKSGDFDYYIDRFEYQMKCFDKGNEFFENERIKNTIILYALIAMKVFMTARNI